MSTAVTCTKLRVHEQAVSKPGYSATLLGPRYVPQEISTPLARLTGERSPTRAPPLHPLKCFRTGHDSIVNTALCHPYEPYILTAGIERFIRLHSPTATSPSTEPLLPTPKTVRTIASSSPGSHDIFLRAMGLLDDAGLGDQDDDDSQSIALFDQCVRFLVQVAGRGQNALTRVAGYCEWKATGTCLRSVRGRRTR